MIARILLGFVLLSVAMEVHPQGTVQFFNSALSRVQMQESADGPIKSASSDYYVGLFWGTNAIQWRLTQPVIRMRDGGLFDGGSSYPIPGTEPGQTVYMKLVAWGLAAGTNGSSERIIWPPWGDAGILPITLGPTEGPGTQIMQSISGTNAYRFKPFTVCGDWCSNNRPTWHFNSVVGVRGPGHLGEATFLMIRYDPYFSYLEDRVGFYTRDGTALAGRDYVGTTGGVHFPTGSMNQWVRIQLLPSDGTLEDRTFQIYPGAILSPPWNPPLIFSGTGTIRVIEITAIKPGPTGTSIDFVATPNRIYSIQSSEDLITWTTVPGLTDIRGTGSMSVIDTRPDCCGLRFYRITALP
jgi:hypothetical protein